MPAVRTPAEILNLLHERISAGRWLELSELYAEDAVVDLPMNIPEPDHVEGRAEIHRRFEGAAAAGFDFKVTQSVVHDTSDPEVAIAEFVFEGRAGAEGDTFRAWNVQVLRARDGVIVETRDYHDHFRLGVDSSRLPSA
jgi:uncharacterized protein